MAKLTRYLQKIFANNSNQVGVFGTGTDKVASKNVETLQSSDYEDGWSAAIVTEKNYPIWQERDGVDYGLSYQIKYLDQAGVAEWLSTETYYTDCYCRYGSDIYISLKDDNTNHSPLLNDGWWMIIDKKFLNKSQITNVITEILQDIKLELSSGTLTLKAGSKVYVPDGFEQDGTTLKFTTITTTADKTITASNNDTMLIFYRTDGVLVQRRLATQTKSGTSTPSSGYWGYYNTDNNILYQINDGTVGSNHLSFPIAMVTANSSSIISIDKVFNGFGFIGSNYFVLPNVKALFADGRNADGSYKNLEVTYTSVITGTAALTATPKAINLFVTGIGDMQASNVLYGLKKDLPATVGSTSRYRYYAIDENIWYTTNGSTTANWTIQKVIIIGGLTGNGTYITEFNPIQMPIKLTNSNDVDGQWVLKHVTVVDGATIPTSTNTSYSLATYLPNDGFNYEVLIDGSVNTTTTSGSYACLYLGSDIIDSPTCICEARTRTSSTVNGGGNITMPVGGGRSIYVGYGSGYTGTYKIDVRAYRRIGRNV